MVVLCRLAGKRQRCGQHGELQESSAHQHIGLPDVLDIVTLLWQLSGVGPVLCSLLGKTFQIVYCHETRRILQTNSSRHGAASSCAQKQQHRPTQKVPNRMLFTRCIAYRTSSVDSSFYAQASQHKLMTCVLHGCPILDSGNNHSSPVECTFNRTGKKSLSCRRAAQKLAQYLSRPSTSLARGAFSVTCCDQKLQTARSLGALSLSVCVRLAYKKARLRLTVPV